MIIIKIGFITDTNILKRNQLKNYEKTLDATDIYTEYIQDLNIIQIMK